MSLKYMEMENSNHHHENRKRRRDHQRREHEEEKEYSHKDKKHGEELITRSTDDDSSSYKLVKGYEEKFNDGIGVFDFPWLKEGVIFKADEFLEPQFQLDQENYTFGTCSYFEEGGYNLFSSNLDQAHEQIPSNHHEIDRTTSSKLGHDNDRGEDGESSWSFLVDDLEPVDCIWRCVVDQPLDIGLNKA